MSDEMKNQVDPDQKVTDAAVTPAENTSPADTQAEQTPVSPAPETAPQPETPQEAESLQKFCPQCGAPLAPELAPHAQRQEKNQVKKPRRL